MPRLSKLEQDLNPAQREAVRHTEGPLLVLSGAGSGKTRVVTRRIAHIIAKRIAKPSQILAVTFTNKAAGEMRARVAGLVGKKRAADVVLSTYHSFCLQVLRQYIEHLGYRKNFTISGEGDTRTIIRRVLDDLDGVNETFSPGMFREEISMLKGNENKNATPEAPNEAKDVTQEKYRTWLPEVFDRYQSALRAANSLDFDDLLTFTLKLWDEHPKILDRYQKQFKYIMVDEYQDTNHVQYQLIQRLVAKHSNLCVVGDDDQSIYGWRGADVKNILTFEKDFPKAKIVNLSQNYRSSKNIIDSANAVIANNKTRRPKKMTPELPEGRPIDWLITGDEEHEAKMVASWIEHIQSKTGATCSDFAVLYRSNLQSRPLEIALRHAGKPYVVVGGQAFFERAEVRDVLAYLKLLTNPRDEASFLRIVNVPRRGIGDVTLHAIHDICRENNLSLGKGMAEALKSDRLPTKAAQGVRSFLGLIGDFRKTFRAREASLSELVRALIDSVGYRAELERTSRTPEIATMRWENVEAVLRAVEAYETSVPAPTLRGFLDETTLVPDPDPDDSGEERPNAVTLMTAHSAKGLEFPFVFIVGVEEGLFPHDKSMNGPALEEERRLFYVALTRAQRHVTLFEALARTRHGREKLTTTSRFVKEVPDNLLKRRIHAARDMVEARMEKPKKKPTRRSRKNRSRSRTL